MAGIIQVICVCVIFSTSANGFWSSRRRNASPPRIVIINPTHPPPPPTTTTTPPPPSCPVGEILCKKTNYEYGCATLCNAISECEYYIDEINCPCENGTLRCRLRPYGLPGCATFCDGIEDCLYGIDEPEENCNCTEPTPTSWTR